MKWFRDRQNKPCRSQFNGGLGNTGLKIVLDDLAGLFHLKQILWFYNLFICEILNLKLTIVVLTSKALLCPRRECLSHEMLPSLHFILPRYKNIFKGWTIPLLAKPFFVVLTAPHSIHPEADFTVFYAFGGLLAVKFVVAVLIFLSLARVGKTERQRRTTQAWTNSGSSLSLVTS